MNRDWLPPKPPRAHPAWVIASVVVHAAVLGVLLLIGGHVVHVPGVSYILLPGGPERAPVAYDMVYVPQAGGGPGPAVGTGAERRRAPGAAPSRVTPGEGIPAVPGGADTTARAGIAGGPGGEEATGPGHRLLGARYGDGRVWVRPWDAIAAAIAAAGAESAATPAAHAARIDSAITVRLLAFLDTLPPDSMATPQPKPWVTEIDGRKWGIDGGWIYLGDLKLPTAILALLPLPQGNYEQAQRAAELQRVRLDIMQAARRAESAEQFKKYVKETRERRDAERQAKKNQRLPPDSTGG